MVVIQQFEAFVPLPRSDQRADDRERKDCQDGHPEEIVQVEPWLSGLVRLCDEPGYWHDTAPFEILRGMSHTAASSCSTRAIRKPTPSDRASRGTLWRRTGS